MADYNLVGRIRPVYKGVWQPDADYTVLDVVVSADKHTTYIANKDVPAGVTLADVEYWGVMVDASDMVVSDSVLQNKANALSTKASGNPVQIYPDTGNILKPVSVMNPIQAGSGDPYPPGGGKNICPGFENGIAYSNNDGSDLGNAAYGRTLKIPIKDGVTYVQSNSQGLAVSNVHFWDADGNWISQVKTNDINTRPDGVDAAFMAFVYYRGAGVNLEWVQVEVGTTVSEYKPYSNIRPITGRTGAKLTRRGKNLLPNTAGNGTTNGITFTLNPDGSVTADGTATANTYYDINKALSLPAGQYALSGCPSSSNGANYLVYAQSANGDKYDSGKGVNFDAAADETWYVRIKIASGITVSNLTFYPMIRLASVTDETYEPYRGDAFALDFGQTVYSGTLDWNNGVLMVDRALKTLTGAENYQHNDSWANTGLGVLYGSTTGIVNVPGYGAIANLICSHAKIVTPATAIAENGIVGVGQQDVNLYISLGASDKNALVSYISAQYAAGTPVQIAYELAAPITIQLAPQQITALDGINTVYTDGDSLFVDYNKSLRRAFDEVVARLAALEATVTDT